MIYKVLTSNWSLEFDNIDIINESEYLTNMFEIFKCNLYLPDIIDKDSFEYYINIINSADAFNIKKFTYNFMYMLDYILTKSLVIIIAEYFNENYSRYKNETDRILTYLYNNSLNVYYDILTYFTLNIITLYYPKILNDTYFNNEWKNRNNKIIKSDN